MATKTIEGCVLSDGRIEFTDASCKYHACRVPSGVHAGMIQLTHPSYRCPDTYYGCVDPVTHKFEVILPDTNCCQSCSNCPSGTTPFALMVSFQGAPHCSGVCCVGNYKLSYPGPDGSFIVTNHGSNCYWWDSIGWAHLEVFDDPENECKNLFSEQWWELFVTVEVLSNGHVFVIAPWFYGYGLQESGTCVNAVANNSAGGNECCQYPETSIASGGTATVTPYEYPL